MSQKIAKAIILPIIFVVSVIGFNLFLNQENTDLITTMADASFPLVSVVSYDKEVNQLHGYVDEMQENYVRDTITPISSDRQLPIYVDTYGNKIEGISYEIRSLDTSRLVESTEVTEFTEANQRVSATLPIKNLIDVDTEYVLTIVITTKTDTLRYYTRIIQESQEGSFRAQELMSFVDQFHQGTFDKKDSELATYLEVDSSGDSKTLSYVDIHSSYNQVTWGDMEVTVVKEPVLSIDEINASYGVFTMNYTVTAPNEDGETEYYNVEEYYRVRFAAERMYLLNYERTMNQIISPEGSIINNGNLNLGIRGEDVKYISNEAQTISCFVQEGDLWSYNKTSNRLVKIFSFRGGEGIDARENFDDYDINIVRVDETGSVDFVVDGYMNRGDHEGEVGISFYHFDALNSTIEEMAFIKSTKSYSYMKESIGNLLYSNDNGQAFLMLNNTLYKIDLQTRDVEAIVENLDPDCYVTSDDGRMLAWEDENKPYEATKIHILCLETMNEYQVKAGANEKVKALGFMESDFIYGVTNESDITEDITGSTVFPMSKIEIISEGEEIVKEYYREGIYVTDVSINGNVIALNRVTKSGSQSYSPTTQDNIMSSKKEAENVVTTKVASDDLKLSQIEIVFPKTINETTVKSFASKEVTFSESRNVTIEESTSEKAGYYVAAKGEIDEYTNVISDAITDAESVNGVVLGENQEYIWVKGNQKTSTQLKAYTPGSIVSTEGSLAECLSIILGKDAVKEDISSLLGKQVSAKEILQKYLGMDIFDLSGCSVENVLYYVSQGSPVLAMKDSSHALLIVGYNELNIIVLDPVTGTTYKIGLNDSKEMFDQAGNVFITYLPASTESETETTTTEDTQQ